MQRTLLDFTQEVLSSLGSDEVNSIDDTIESQSVSKIVRRSFYNIVDRRELLDQKDMFQLESSGDDEKPVLMSKPASVRSIDWIKYDVQSLEQPITNMQLMQYVTPEHYLYLSNNLRPGSDNVVSFEYTKGSSTLTLYIRNDTAPKYYTTFNDTDILFDSFDTGVDTTLQQSKTQCYGGKHFQFSLNDTFVPPLTDEQQNLLLNEAISLAWVELKQAPNPKAEVMVRKQWIRQQHTGRNIPTKIDPLLRAPNFGRK